MDDEDMLDEDLDKLEEENKTNSWDAFGWIKPELSFDQKPKMYIYSWNLYYYSR